MRIPGSVPAGLAAAIVKVCRGDETGALGSAAWLALGHTDMRRGADSLALQVQELLGRDPHAAFRGKRGHLIKILWRDGIGVSLYTRRLERGRLTDILFAGVFGM